MTDICIVDDHESIRDSYKKAIEESGNFRVTGSLPSASVADIWCGRNMPQLVLMDVCTEGGASGLDAAKRIKEKYPDIKIIVMTGFDEISYVSRAKAAGADAFVYKSKSFEHLKKVIELVMNGEKYFPEPKHIPVPQGEAPLTEREMEVLRLVCKNYSRAEIAEMLFLSEYTVKRHIQNMLEKTGYKSIVALAVYMVSNGWINPNF
jgi:DNA-binding NarL/FixJ family response regulator